MTEQVTDFNIRPVFYPPQYAAGPVYAAPTYTVTREPTNCTAIFIAALLATALAVAGAVAAWRGLNYSDAYYETAKTIAVSHDSARVRIGEADANARAGFGNNDAYTQQYAVTHLPAVVAPPAPPPAMTGCNVCGSQQKIATTAGAPPGRCFAPANSVHAGEMGFLWHDGSCHKYSEN